MHIGGFQKLTLLDFPGKIAAIIFTQGCKFRCSYCHNPELISFDVKNQIPQEEIFSYLSQKKHFLSGVCITGGEPTLQQDLPEFIQSLKDLGYAIKLDTNGIHPEMIEKLLSENYLDYIAMDIKAPWKKYPSVSNVENSDYIDNCQRTFSLIQNTKVPHEFRTTILPGEHTENDFFEIARYFQEEESYFIQDAQFDKTLKKNIDRFPGFNVKELILKLRTFFPHLHIEGR